MPNPIIFDWIPVATLAGQPRLFKISGMYFDPVTTRFTIVDTDHPLEVWNPSSHPPDAGSVQNGGKQASFSSTPTAPLPTSGELCIGANLNGNITTTHSISKPYVYANFQTIEPQKGHPTIIEFEPAVYTFGTNVALLLTGLNFSHSTVVTIEEIYAPGVTWEKCETVLVNDETIAVIATLTKTGEPIPGPGYLQVNVQRHEEPVISEMRKWVTYNLELE